MCTWLNVAEKPSVAKEISFILSNGTYRSTATHSRYNPVFEFDMNGKHMLCTSVKGHLMTDEFPPQAKNWTNYPIQELFTATLTRHVKPEMSAVKRNLETLGRRATTLGLWMDCDSEGENICFEVINVVSRVNSRIKICRAVFSALTKRDIFRAMENLRQPNRAVADAVDARQEIDLRVGAVFSRFQTLRFRDMFSGMPRVLSFGPCQIPTLGFVVRRSWERKGFVPEDYFTLVLRHNNTTFNSLRGSMYDLIAATLVFETMLEEARETPEAEIVEVIEKREVRRRHVPLATVELQKLCASHLRITSEQCMMWAESLYQEGYLSYPRTETDSFTMTDEELLEIAALQSTNPEVSGFVDAMLRDPQNKYCRPLDGGHSDNAHPPIYPTKPLHVKDDRRAPLYNFIVRYFLACISPDAVGATTSVTAVFGGEKFTTSGTVVLENGWMEVYPYKKWYSSTIPLYKRGERFVPTDANLQKHRTSPPPNLTERDLIHLMNENGIGTDATIPQHIKTILDREYVRREGSDLVPTPLGIALASAYEVIGLVSLLQPQLRAQTELAMDDIAKGRATKQDVVDASVRLYREIFQKLSNNSQEVYRELYTRLSPVFGAGSLVIEGGPAKTSRRGLVHCGSCQNLMDLMEYTDRDHGSWVVRCATCAKEYRVPNARRNHLEPLSQRCVICGFGVLDVKNIEKQTSHTICVHCFSVPPPGADIESSTEFRCFHCVANCPLAKGFDNVSITRCTACNEHDMRLRGGGIGNFLACRGFPHCTFCINLPRAKRVIPVQGDRCGSCNAVLLQFEFGGIQTVPGVVEGEKACVLCDTRLQEYITMKGGVQQGGVRPAGEATAQPRGCYTLPIVKDAKKVKRRGLAAVDSNEVSLCDCGVPAVQLVSRKQGSKGRHFLKCDKRKCSFFQWLD
uniref:DNA topoisomerase n=1 Tax=Trypanosoma congolense (strain IL3000) TaxID=1068625 RepID=G0V1K6_TRYCI|nr:unnamed protein product [Trypanosoma congolense IL3000]